jgi:hypothetical protein
LRQIDQPQHAVEIAFGRFRFVAQVDRHQARLNRSDVDGLLAQRHHVVDAAFRNGDRRGGRCGGRHGLGCRRRGGDADRGRTREQTTSIEFGFTVHFFPLDCFGPRSSDVTSMTCSCRPCMKPTPGPALRELVHTILRPSGEIAGKPSKPSRSNVMRFRRGLAVEIA